MYVSQLNIGNMRFFDRTEEIASLKEIQEFSKHNAQFTVVTRRRRIGKTHLVWKAYEDQPILYFFVARKGENEIDIVAENELDQQALFIEVKRKIENYDPELLSSKVEVFTRAIGQFKEYTVTLKGVSMDDM